MYKEYKESIFQKLFSLAILGVSSRKKAFLQLFRNIELCVHDLVK